MSFPSFFLGDIFSGYLILFLTLAAVAVYFVSPYCALRFYSFHSFSSLGLYTSVCPSSDLSNIYHSHIAKTNTSNSNFIILCDTALS